MLHAAHPGKKQRLVNSRELASRHAQAHYTQGLVLGKLCEQNVITSSIFGSTSRYMMMRSLTGAAFLFVALPCFVVS